MKYKKEHYIKNKNKICERTKRNYLKRKFGITQNQYNEIFYKQNGLCAICKNPESRKDFRTNEITKLAIDHCHKTGKIRGLLCYRCNSAIGYFQENIEYLKSAIIYLKLSISL